MGYVNATAEFQRHMNNTPGPLLWDESEEVPALTQNDEQMWDRLKEGAYCTIWLKTEEKSILRVLEVLEVVDGQQLIGWHYIHRAPGAFNPELPLAQRRLMPESGVGALAYSAARASEAGDGRSV